MAPLIRDMDLHKLKQDFI